MAPRPRGRVLRAAAGAEPAPAGDSPAAARDPGPAFVRLVAVLDRLRSPGGCPWDARQTHASLAPYAIEEAYELADAAERGDLPHLADELGDLLLQVVFHARIGREAGAAAFDVVDVVENLIEKLTRRHPHVFGDVRVADAAEVSANWAEIKRAERAVRPGAGAGVPLALPALARAQKVVRRLAGSGRPARPAPAADAGASLGHRLLALVAEAEAAGLDAEAELRAAVRDLEAGAAGEPEAPPEAEVASPGAG